jgi:CubicO group peptidase (beta-lactamase class C family)
MGAERDAYVTVDRLGAPRCAGGVCATTRDLARVGQLIVDGGARGSIQIIPEEWIDDVLHNGSEQAWNSGPFTSFFPGEPMHYRSKWYVQKRGKPLLFCLGVFGQNLFVDRENEIVIAKFSSQAPPLDAELIQLTMQTVARIRGLLSDSGAPSNSL